MSNSVLADIHGPDWPVGCVKVTTPGTPVGIMSVADPNGIWNPETGVVPLSGLPGYTVRCQQISFCGVHNNGTTWVPNTGNIYVLRAGPGSANRADSGVLVIPVAPGQTFFLSASPLVNNVWNPYRYFIDADNASDGANIVLYIF